MKIGSLILHELVDDYPSGFIAGKNILKRVGITQEVIYQYKQRRHDGYILKLDLEKAYDMI